MVVRFSEPKRFDVTLEFTEDVVRKLCKYRKAKGRRESGGMLFCKSLEEDITLIEGVTGPSCLDVCEKYLFLPNKKLAQRKIDKMFKAGFHYVGDWHSHSESKPAPSARDMATIKSIFKESTHNLSYMVHVIISSYSGFENAYVAVTDGVTVRQCHCMRTF